MSTETVKQEATNRGIRTTYQGAIAVVLVSVLPILNSALDDGWENADWTVTGYAALTAAVTAVVSYIYNLVKPAPEVA